MDRSSFLARLIGPTFVAIALGILINLSTYERMIAEALRPGHLALSVRPTVAARGPRDHQSAQYVAHGLARDHHGAWLADDNRWHNPHRRATGHDRDWFDGV
jgi:hypothetical protein